MIRTEKVSEGSPNVVDLIRAGKVDLIVNTPRSEQGRRDGYALKYPAVVDIVEFIKERTISKQQVHDGVVRRRRLPVTEFPGKNIRIVRYQVVFRPSDDDQAI